LSRAAIAQLARSLPPSSAAPDSRLVIFFILPLFCSRATTHDASRAVLAAEPPADLAMNEEAGRGGWSIVTFRLESGEELPFVVDTGASNTLIDKSLEPRLGTRLGETTLGRWS
jgi:hypothetical protein